MHYLVWPFCLIAGRSLAGDRTEINRHLGTIGAHPTITIHPHIHIQLRQPVNEDGYHQD